MVRHLFLDNEEIERTDGLRRTVNRPSKDPRNPVLVCEHPWEMLGIQTYGTVVHDREQDLFKVWYLTHAGPSSERIVLDGAERLANMTLLAYAESRDGIDWMKPDLGQMDFNGSMHNNLLRIGRLNVEGASILLDRQDPDPGRRYKAFYWEHGSGEITFRDDGSCLWGKGEGDGMWVSFSPDGIIWTNHPRNPVIDFDSDTGQSVVWDPGIERYVAYGRFGAGGRKVARSESPDFVHWTQPKLVLEPDGKDGPSTQFYGISVTLYEGIYIGLLWVFHIECKSDGSDIGTIDIQLVSSRDGAAWRRVGNRSIFLPNGPPGSWDSCMIEAACRFVTLEDQHLIYYNAVPHKHGRGSGGSRSQIGLARIRRDGFVSLDAGDPAGSLTTKAFAKPPGDLHLNIDAEGGEVDCHLIGPSGQTLCGPSHPISVNSLDCVPSWPGPQPRDIDGIPIKLVIRMRSAKLYSYWFA